MLIVYVITTHALSDESGVLEIPEESRLDLRYARRYHCVASALVLASVPCVGLGEEGALALTALSAASLLWLGLHLALFGEVCSVPYVKILRAAGAVGVLCTASLLRWSGELPCLWFSLGWAVLCVVTLAVVLLFRHLAWRRCWKELVESGVPQELSSLLVKTQQEVHLGNALVDGYRHREIVPSHRAVAKQILNFELHIRAERLTEQFLTERKEWRSKLYRARSFEILHHLTRELRAALRAPPTYGTLSVCVKRALGRQDVAAGVLVFLVAIHRLRSCIKEVLSVSKSDKKNGVNVMYHFRSGGQSLNTALKALRSPPERQ